MHTAEYCTTVRKKNEVDLHRATWIGLRNKAKWKK